MGVKGAEVRSEFTRDSDEAARFEKYLGIIRFPYRSYTRGCLLPGTWALQLPPSFLGRRPREGPILGTLPALFFLFSSLLLGLRLHQ